MTLLLQPRFDSRKLFQPNAYTFSLIFLFRLLWTSEYSLLSLGKTRFVLLVIAGVQVTLASSNTPKYLTGEGPRDVVSCDENLIWVSYL